MIETGVLRLEIDLTVRERFVAHHPVGDVELRFTVYPAFSSTCAYISATSWFSANAPDTPTVSSA